MNPLSNTPDQVVIAGDWHGDTIFALTEIEKIAALRVHLIIHCGDFGVWPGSSFISKVSLKCEQYDITIVFVDGNHEWHDEIDEWHIAVPGPVAIDRYERIWHLPRGTRWTWHGRTWLAVGGAGSPDKLIRTEGVSWWPQELITEQQVDEISGAGPADVLVSHDCPKDFMPPREKLMWPIPRWWDMEPCYLSSERLQRIVNATEPKFVFHGHLHLYREDTYRSVEVVGLDMNQFHGNWIIVSTETMGRRLP